MTKFKIVKLTYNNQKVTYKIKREMYTAVGMEWCDVDGATYSTLQEAMKMLSFLTASYKSKVVKEEDVYIL